MALGEEIFKFVYLCSSDFVDTLSNETSSEVQEGLDDILTRMKGRVFAQIHTFLLTFEKAHEQAQHIFSLLLEFFLPVFLFLDLSDLSKEIDVCSIVFPLLCF